MNILVTIIVLLVLAYSAALEYLRRQWKAMPALAAESPELENQPEQDLQHQKTISVLVVARNEEEKLPHLFKALLDQSLSPLLFELHLVDDGSSDKTFELAEAFKDFAPFPVQVHRLVLPKEGGSPKKAAITQVLPFTIGSLIVVTDADCVPEQQWLEHIYGLWKKRKPVFISGPVRYRGEQNLFERLQAIDFAALIGVGAAMLASGRPGMCNAANMAFSKKSFFAVGGYNGNEHVPSGDDEFLLQKLAGKYPDKIVFLKSAGAVVNTSACSSWRQFLHQRKRWAGKWRLHKSFSATFVALAVFVFYLLLAVALVLPFFQPHLLYLLVPALLVKGAADYRFLKPVLHFLKKPLPLNSFLLMEFVYPFYVLFFAVAANWGSFNWKERSYRYSMSGHE